MAGFKFKMHFPTGEDIGTFVTAVPNWKVGDELIGDGHVWYRIVGVRDDLGDDSEYMGVRTVTPVELAEPS